ncbi:MAG: hypothetical protein LBI82_07190, partial [Dysgonamonadaceae bacterium]|nr:hypothetical protein [Dysgonamonadaceae bacterium]
EDKFVELPDGTKSVYEKNEFTYKANEDVRVVVDDVQYLSVTGSIGGRESYFYEIIYEKDENMVLQEHKYGTVLLKLANQKKPEELGYTALFGTKKPEKIKKEFDEYVNCPALTYSDYATNTVEGLIELVNDYVEKCK